jgi:O-antigen/teichoic acid export membrane protein
VIIFGILGAYSILGKDFIALWMGKTYLQAWSTSMYVMVGSIFSSVVVSGHAILKAQNRQSFIMLIYFIIFSVNVIATYIVTPVFGIEGAAICTCLAFACGNIFFMWPYYHTQIHINMFELIKNILPIMGICLGTSVVVYALRKLLNDVSLFWFIVEILIYLIMYLSLVWISYLKPEEKAFLRNNRR